MNEIRDTLRESPDLAPYGDKLVPLLDSFFEALRICSLRFLAGEATQASDPALRECFSWINPDPHSTARKDLHLMEGIGRKNETSRLAALTVNRFNEVQRYAKYTRNKDVVSLLVPSPLALLYDALTVPEEPATRAYALTACKRLLFLRLRIYPSVSKAPEGWERLDVEDVERELDSQRKYLEHRDNPPVSARRATALLQQFLAMKGHYCLRFGSWRKVNVSDARDLRKIVDDYFRQRDLLGKVRHDGYCDVAYEYRRSPLALEKLRAWEVVNELFGIPIPIRGADTVFYGGLRRSADDSLLINVSGAAGTGKTSFALSFAAMLAPYKTRCYYVTTEEAVGDLRDRLLSLTPAYMRDLSLYGYGNQNQWFYIKDLSASATVQTREGAGTVLLDHMEEVRVWRDRNRKIAPSKKGGGGAIPDMCPLLVVVDSLLGMVSGVSASGVAQLEQFLDVCRDLGAVVVLLSGEELPKNTRLSYMVDVFIKLTYRNTDDEAKKPERLLELTKTRFQLSRPGSHVFHMSGRDGLRISPQLTSQLDKDDEKDLTLPDESQVIDCLNVWDPAIRVNESFWERVYGAKRYVDLFAFSRILIHGHGSSTKAGLGLKILLTPISTVGGAGSRHSVIEPGPRRVLIVSFLYPEAYYHARLKEMRGVLKQISGTAGREMIECLYFTPGFLPPEDLLGTISRKIEEAELRGRPFTGVLLDGLHNVFLSFPVLQERELLWPSLYHMLSVRKLTIVTTFTTFVVDLQEREDGPEETEIRRKGQTALLHALVMGADFYLSLDRVGVSQSGAADCALRVKGAAGEQEAPSSYLLWNRRTCGLSCPVLPKQPETVVLGS